MVMRSMVKSPTSKRRDAQVTERILSLERNMDSIRKDLQVQFKRIAQLQAQIDQIQGAWAKLKRKQPTPSGA